jgi:hypothetical protein
MITKSNNRWSYKNKNLSVFDDSLSDLLAQLDLFYGIRFEIFKFYLN